MSGPGVRTFVNIAGLWGLTGPERIRLLGSPHRSTYYAWLKAAKEHKPLELGVDTLTRISGVLGVHKALRILYGDERDGVAWLKSPNTFLAFGGQAPVTVLTSGPLDAILTVRRHLDAARGGIYMTPTAIDRDFKPYKDTDLVFE